MGDQKRWGCIGLAIGLFLSLTWVPALHAEQWEGPYVGAMGSYIDTDDGARRFTDESSTGIKLLFGWPMSSHLNLEVLLDYDNLETAGVGTDFYRTALELDALYHFGSSGWAPFIVGGIGAVYNDVLPNSQDKTTFTANAGLGLMSAPMTDYGVRLRGDVRYVYDDFQDGPGDVHVNLGLIIPLRRPSQTVEVVKIKEVVREVVREVPVAVAPMDSDHDGVIDGEDRCPNTLPGAEVDQYGCAKVKSVTQLRGVNFEFDSAQLTTDSTPMLNRAVDAMKGQPGMEVEVAGHTDSTGSTEYNQRLSERRTDSVVEYLTTHGIDPERMTPAGYGESQPVTSNDTAEGRAQNRRVEFRVKTQ